jgi:hypothetical protein
MGKIVGGLFGSKPKEAKQNTAGFLRPFGFTSPLYDTQIDIDGDQKNFSVTNTDDPRLTGIMNRQLDAVDPLLQLQIQEFQNRPANFNYNFDPAQATQGYFDAGMNVLNPIFAQQQNQMQNNLFGSGRLGLMLAGDAAGAGAGAGMVNPDAFGLARGQGQAMTDLYANSRAAAMREGDQMFNQSLKAYQQNELARQNYLQQLGVGQSGLLNQALGLDDQSRKAALQALEMERLRGNMISATPYGGGTTGQKGLLQSGAEAFLGSAGGSAALAGIFGGGGTGGTGGTGGSGGGDDGGGGWGDWVDLAATAASYYMASGGSDVRLKTNITPIGKANGFNLYSWDWNEKAIELGLGEQATYGVMAQEVIKTMPSAVHMADDGYYRVQYDKIFGKPSGGTL